MTAGRDPPQPSLRRRQAFRARLLRWFDAHGRRFPWRAPRASTYLRIVSEVLLQRTRAEVVARIIPAFLERYPSWASLARAGEADLQEVLRPLGLWRRRAVSIRGLARYADSTRGRFPSRREDVESVPAVGQYVANAIWLFAHRRPAPLLDSNMARVLERYFGPRRLADIRYDPYLQLLAASIVDCERSIDLNWAILDLGALVCKPSRPDCPSCPLRPSCRHARSQAAALTISAASASRAHRRTC